MSKYRFIGESDEDLKQGYIYNSSNRVCGNLVSEFISKSPKDWKLMDNALLAYLCGDAETLDSAVSFNRGYAISSINYKSWDNLMRVIHAIQKLKGDEYSVETTLTNSYFLITFVTKSRVKTFYSNSNDVGVHYALVEFALWYLRFTGELE